MPLDSCHFGEPQRKNEMNDANENETGESDAESAIDTTPPIKPTQAQLYDDLRRIGQLEDQKLAIQQEIDVRTERLRNAIPHLDDDSLLCKMLTSSLAKPAAPKRKAKRKTTARKKPARKSKVK